MSKIMIRKHTNERSGWARKALAFGTCSILVFGSLLFSAAVPAAEAAVVVTEAIRATRIAQLTVPGRFDTVVLTGGPVLRVYSGTGGLLWAKRIGIPDRAMTQLADVVDLDGDGLSEIVGYYPGDPGQSKAPVLYVVNGNGTLRNSYDFPNNKLDIGPGGIRVFDVLGTTPLQRRIVVAPNTTALESVAGANSNVWFFNPNGSLRSMPFVEGTDAPPNREILPFPGIAVGALNGTTNTVLVVVKGRFLFFDQNGDKLVYFQICDPEKNDDVGYATEPDDPDGPDGPVEPWAGRRYGSFKFANADADNSLELIVAADTNPYNRPDCLDNPPGALYQVFELGTVSANTPDGFLNETWGRWIPRSSVELSDTTWPGNTTGAELCPENEDQAPRRFEGYCLGTPAGGIDDLNGDGKEEIVVGESPVDGQYRIKIIKGDGTVVDTGINGICIGVTRLMTSGNLRELVVWNPNTDRHKLYRPAGVGSYSFSEVTENPAGTLSSDTSLMMVKRQFPDDFTLTGVNGVNTLEGEYDVMIGRSGGTRSIIGTSGCSLRSWTANGSQVQPSLNYIASLESVVNVLRGSSNTDWTWLLRPEVSCAVTDQLETYMQSGSSLEVTDPPLSVAVTGNDTIGVYSASNAFWFLRNSNSAGPADLVYGYGPAGAIPISGDWNGDGIETPGIYVPSSGGFFLRNSNSTGVADVVFTFGGAGLNYVPLAGDWDGDGKDGVGLYDPASGAFFLKYANTSGAADLVQFFGGPNMTPLVGDWNGDGVDSIGVYANTAFFLTNSARPLPAAEYTFTFGGGGSIPITGDWNGDGVDTIGTYVSLAGFFYLRNSNTSGSADLSFGYASPSLTPLTGNWDGL